jgi:uncharacterized protein YcbK (DUF882 family)
MRPRFIAPCLAGLVVTLGLTVLAGRAPAPHPALALSVIEAPSPREREAAARRLVIIEPLATPPVTVKLANVNTDETGAFAIGADGTMEPTAAVALQHFFRCRRTGKEMPMAPGVLALLADVAKHWPGRTIEIVSGYRAAPFGAPHSKHFRGHAIDLRIHGVRTAVLRDWVWRNHHQAGVGYYPETNFVHMDWRPGEPDIAWTATDEEGAPDYNPRWASRARRLRPSRHPARSSVAVAALSPGTL